MLVGTAVRRGHSDAKKGQRRLKRHHGIDCCRGDGDTAPCTDRSPTTIGGYLVRRYTYPLHGPRTGDKLSPCSSQDSGVGVTPCRLPPSGRHADVQRHGMLTYRLDGMRVAPRACGLCSITGLQRHRRCVGCWDVPAPKCTFQGFLLWAPTRNQYGRCGCTATQIIHPTNPPTVLCLVCWVGYIPGFCHFLGWHANFRT